MDSDSAISVSSPPPPPPPQISGQEYSSPDSEVTPDPEDYETASEPGVNDADSSAVARDALSPEKNALKSSTETGDEGEIHDSTKQGGLGENSDSAGNSNRGFLGFGKKNDDDGDDVGEVEGEEEKISSVPENLIENDDSGGADDEKSAENGVVESRVEETENFGGENVQSTNYDTGVSLELEPEELEEDDTTVADMQTKASESGVTDYSSSPNQKASEEVEPKYFESETSIAAIGEAEDDERPVNPVEAGVVDEAGSKVSVGEENLLKDDAPVFEIIDSKDEIVDSGTKSIGDDLDQAHSSVISERSTGEGEIAPHTAVDDGDLNSAEEVETHSDISKEAVVGDERPTTGTAREKSVDDEVDEVNLSDISEGNTALSEEITNEKVEVGSEHDSGPGHGEDEVEEETLPVIAKETVLGDDNIDEVDGTLNQEITSEHTAGHGEDEPELKLTADDADLRSAEEEGTPVVPKETIVGDANKLLDQDIDEDKLVSGSENASGVADEEPAPKLAADGGDLNSAEEVENLLVVPKETVVGDENIEGTVIGSTAKLDGTLNQEISEDKLAFGSENASGDGDDEPALKLIARDGDLNSADVVKTLPVTPKESVVRDESINETTNESQLQNSDSDKLASTGLKQASGRGEDEHAKETVPGDEILPQAPELGQKVEPIAESRVGVAEDEKDEDEDGRISDGGAGVAILDGSEAAKQIIREMERISSSSQSGLRVDGQVASDSDEAVDSDEDGEGGELFDSAALAALLKAATSSSDGTVTVTAQDAARMFSVDRPVGLGTSAPSLRPAASRSTRPGLFPPSEIAAVEEPDRSMDDDEKILHEKVEQIRVKFLRLVHRLGHSPGDAVAGQVLYRLSLAEGIKQGRQMGRAFSIESAKKHALQLEEEGKDDLNFSCNIMVIGKTGVGKSATINSIFGEEKSRTNPFQLATASVREICGVVDGVRVRVLDTPGLKPSIMDQATNRKILSTIKNFTKKCPPDIVLYVDRMDTQTRDFNDLPLLKSITSVLGSSIWFNAIVALTHAASAPPDGPNGTPLGYDVFVSQRSHIVQQSIRQAAGDMRLMNPVALVENHPSCRRNREGERILPNGLSWRPQLLLLSYASKILSEANSLLKLQDPSPGKLFGGFRLRSPPLPFLLSSLLQARAHPKLSGDQGGDNADSDVDLDEFSDAEQDEEVDEYDQLPPFKPLKKSQLAMLTKEQKRAYFDEYDYRVKLLQKKQWKEEIRRLKEAKKKGKDGSDEFPNGDMPEDYDQDSGPAAVQVPLPDMVLPPSFDCDNPAFRYRFLEPTSQFLTRPVLDTHGWDHDCGYDGVNIEESLAIAGRFPTSMAVQITKDKKEFNIHLDSSVAVKHGEHGSTVAGFDIQSVGKQLAYILRGETKFDSLKKNKTAAGVSVTFLGETVATGLKLEDRISIGKRLGLVASTGAVRAQGDVAYGANLEVRLKDKDYPVGQALSTLGLSLMKWRNDLALGANLQSQFPVGRNSKMAVRVGLNNKLTGQVTVRTSTSDQLQIALTGIIPLAVYIYRSIKSNESYMDH